MDQMATALGELVGSILGLLIVMVQAGVAGSIEPFAKFAVEMVKQAWRSRMSTKLYATAACMAVATVYLLWRRRAVAPAGCSAAAHPTCANDFERR